MKLQKWIVWVLVLCLLLSGCVQDAPQAQPSNSSISIGNATPTPPPAQFLRYQEADPWDAPKFEDMEYSRPDMDAIDNALAYCTEQVPSTDSALVLAALEHYMMLYSDFATNYWLAYIRYNLDLSDQYWQQEHDFCSEHLAQLESDMDILLRELAASPHRAYLEQQEFIGEGFFDDYDEETLWTEEFTALMEQENALQAEYYALTETKATANELAELMVRMVKLRQKIATAAGYEDYPSFAYDFYYQRDYTVQQVQTYLTEIQQRLVPLYQTAQNSDAWIQGLTSSNTQKTLDFTEGVAQAIGGTAPEAFRLLEQKELHHLRYGYNKQQGAFTAFLPDYMTPFIFLTPTGTTYDHLTLTHEFGHYLRTYANGGTNASIDVEEIFSQGLENLSLLHGGEDITAFRMMMSLSTYVEQGAYADFELRIYNLPSEELTVEKLQQVYRQVKKDYKFDATALNYTDIIHLYVEPMYVISYVTSNDAALQLYQMELADPGSGVACYMANLDNAQPQFMAFLQDTGLDSPFAAGRMEDVHETLYKFLA